MLPIGDAGVAVVGYYNTGLVIGDMLLWDTMPRFRYILGRQKINIFFVKNKIFSIIGCMQDVHLRKAIIQNLTLSLYLSIPNTQYSILPTFTTKKHKHVLHFIV